MTESAIEHVLGWISIASVSLLFLGVIAYVAVAVFRTRTRKTSSQG